MSYGLNLLFDFEREIVNFLFNIFTQIQEKNDLIRRLKKENAQQKITIEKQNRQLAEELDNKK